MDLMINLVVKLNEKNILLTIFCDQDRIICYAMIALVYSWIPC